MSTGDRTIPATPRRRKQLAAQGDVPGSSDLLSVVTLLAWLALGAAGVRGSLNWFNDFTHQTWQSDWHHAAQPEHLQSILGTVVAKLAFTLGVAALAGVVLNVAIQYFQSGRIHWFVRRPRPSLASRLSTIFSFDTIFASTMSLVKLTAIILTTVVVVKSELKTLFGLSTQTGDDLLVVAMGLLFKVCFSSAGCLLFFAAIDWMWTKFRYERRIRMTPEELREEMRQSQSPNVRPSENSQTPQPIQ